MKSIKNILLIILFFSSLISLCQEDESAHKKILIISVPKAGTHLLAKCIQLLTGRQEPVWNTEDQFSLTQNDYTHLMNTTNNQFVMSHIQYCPETEQLLNNNDEIKTFFVYRDLRDQLISFAFYVKKYPSFWANAENLTFTDLLSDIMHSVSIYSPKILCEVYCPWLKAKNICAIRFEDLIGSKGGGSDEAQKNALLKIANHLNISLSNEKTEELISQLFGGSFTFREGKIGSWKKYFDGKLTKEFKALGGKILINLGYEKDLNW